MEYWVFPGDVDFSEFEFEEVVYFDSVQFMGVANFARAKFKKKSFFKNTKFVDIANFNGVHFDEDVIFTRSQFFVAHFRSIFIGNAEFKNIECVKFYADEAHFKNGCDFRASLFLDEVRFHRTQFYKKIDFSGMKVLGDVSFGRAKFHKGSRSIFCRVVCKNSIDFSEVVFKETPEFAQSNISQSPSFDTTVFPDESGRTVEWAKDIIETICMIGRSFTKQPFKIRDVRERFMKSRGDYNLNSLPARYRSLKNMSRESGDWHLEREFSAKEIITRRHVEDFPFSKNFDRYWIGLAFGVLSNYGRSVIRPFVVWLACVFLFCAFYGSPISGRAVEWHATKACVQSTEIKAWKEALVFSVTNALVLTPLTGKEVNAKALGCLYGSTADTNSNMPKRVYLVSMAQKVLSGVLFFLMGLGVRANTRTN
jgi:hypothetical protein